MRTILIVLMIILILGIIVFSYMKLFKKKEAEAVKASEPRWKKYGVKDYVLATKNESLVLTNEVQL